MSGEHKLGYTVEDRRRVTILRAGEKIVTEYGTEG
jgi:hypothetical protein